MDFAEKERRLEQWMDHCCTEDVCVAFSGGVDSGLLLQMACSYGKKHKRKVYGVTVDTVLHPAADLAAAESAAAKAGAVHAVLRLDELAVPELENNPVNRCYLCKRALYSKIKEFAAAHGVSVLLDGTNEDDLHVYRPGLQAVRELEVRTPLADLEITKREVRLMAEKRGIQSAHRPSAPCLATRLPYGTHIELPVLRKIDQAEEWIRSLGFVNVRLRLHGEVVRLEVDGEALGKILAVREELIRGLKSRGFRYITLDLEGFRSGSMDCQEKILDNVSVF